MERIMSRKKNRQNNTTNIETVNVEANIDYDKLALAIVKAQQIVKAENEKARVEEAEAKKKDWHKVVNFVEYPDNEAWHKKAIHTIRNFLCTFCTLLTFKKKSATEEHITYNLLRLCGSSIFGIIKWILYWFTICFLFSSFFTIQQRTIYFDFNLYYIGFSVFSFIFARIFRIASYEIENSNDRQSIISVFSVTTCFLAMIFALIALFKE